MAEEVVIVSSYDLTLRLSGGGTPPGEIALDDLSKIAGSLQEVATRVGRLVVGQEGAGRTVAAAAKVVDLRLSALAQGSTVLEVSFGERDVLPFDVRIESEIADRFWDVVAGVESGRRPDWVTPLLSESVFKLLEALTAAAPEVQVTRADGRRSSWVRGQVTREPWRLPQTHLADDGITVTGRLEKVDLHDRKFRLRDDVGNTIILDDVVDADHVAPLIDQRIAAAGAPEYDHAGRLRGVTGASVTAAAIPDEWKPGRFADPASVFAAVPGPDPNGIEGITGEEVDEFLARLRG